jgi:hypothetical protein
MVFIFEKNDQDGLRGQWDSKILHYKLLLKQPHTVYPGYRCTNILEHKFVIIFLYCLPNFKKYWLKLLFVTLVGLSQKLIK